MPAPGDQHTRISNPFEDVKPRISEYTAQEVATLQSRLEKQLGPEYLSSRSGPSGQKVHYVAAEKVIGLANEVFGFNGWSSSIQNIQVDFVDENPQTLKISLGVSVVVRVTLRDGSFHEDIGYGHIENCKGKAAAFEKAKKEGTTDAMKRALRNFGNVLGNCVYDKSYLAKVQKIKVEPPAKFDESALHRHADFVKREVKETKPFAKPESTTSKSSTTLSALPDIPSDSFDELLGDFDEADFGVADTHNHPDEVTLDLDHDESISNLGNSNGPKGQPPPQPQANSRSLIQPPAKPLTGLGASNSNRGPQTPHMQPPRPGPQMQAHQPGQRPPQSGMHGNNSGRPYPQQTANGMGQHHRPGMGHQTPPPQPPQQGQRGGAPPGDPPVAFFSARAVPRLPDDGTDPPPGADPAKSLVPSQLFNLKGESPSIRKTPGIDHNSSRPVGRSLKHVAPPTSSQAATNDKPNTGVNGAHGDSSHANNISNNTPQRQSPQIGRGNAVNPHLDHARRIGAPGGAGSPLANRGQYKPPTMKRAPLTDLPNGTGNAGTGASGDVKRVKYG